MDRNVKERYIKEAVNEGSDRYRLRSLFLCAIFGCSAEIASSLILGAVLSFFPDIAATYSGQIDSQLSLGLISIFRVVVFAPLFEEALFRYMLLGIMERRIGFTEANIVQALIFGIYHMSLIQGIYAFLLGMLIGLLKYYTGTVKSCICFHVLFNITGVLVNRYVPAEIGSGIRITVMLAALALSAALFIFIRRNRCGAQTA